MKARWEISYMPRFLIRLLSCFIKDREKRRKFRYKYDDIGRMKDQINELSDICNFVRENSIDIDTETLNWLCMNYAIENGIIKDEKEHLENLEALKRNLDKEALENLNNILNRLKRGENRKRLLLTEAFNDDEIREFLADRENRKNVKKVGNHYEYKHFKLPLGRFGAEAFTYYHGTGKLKTFKDMKGAIIDAGAYIGDSFLALRDVTQNPIIAFEPSYETCKLARQTIELNNLKDVTIECMALGDTNGEGYINIETHLGNNNVAAKGASDKQEKIKITTLDDYVKEHNIQVGLIKTDVEGFEMNLIKGALNTIKTQKPILIISLYHSYNDFYKIKPYLESLDLGYKFDFFKGTNYHYHADIYLLAEVY